MGALTPEQTGPRTLAAAAGKIFRSPVWAFVLIFLLSFAVRATLLVSLAESRENFYRLGSGIEDRVALSLLRTGEFADPYLIPSGPTAHPPPLWPGILALTYSATAGVYIGGGIALKILPVLEDGPFLDAFRAKDPLTDLLRTIPVAVI